MRVLVDIFPHGFSVPLPEGVDPKDENAVYEAIQGPARRELARLWDTLGFDFDVINTEVDND